MRAPAKLAFSSWYTRLEIFGALGFRDHGTFDMIQMCTRDDFCGGQDRRWGGEGGSEMEKRPRRSIRKGLRIYKSIERRLYGR